MILLGSGRFLEICSQEGSKLNPAIRLTSVVDFTTLVGKYHMKRFWLFYGEQYYANGGMGDFAKDFDTTEEAVWAAKTRDKSEQEEVRARWEKGGNFTYEFKPFKDTWAHVWDTKLNKEVWSSWSTGLTEA